MLAGTRGGCGSMTEKNAPKRARNAAGPVTGTDTPDRAAAVLTWMTAITISTLTLVLQPAPLLALDPSLEVNQYGHTAWTARNGFSVGAIYAMAQTPDGYLWLGSEFGLFRFDGDQAVPWQPPAGQQLPDKPYALLVTRDGTLWVGTFARMCPSPRPRLPHREPVSAARRSSNAADRDPATADGPRSASPPCRGARADGCPFPLPRSPCAMEYARPSPKC
jgi:hypothetical protein